MRNYVARLLKSAGYRVESVADGEAALIAARALKPSLVLSDVMMPNLDGIGLMDALRSDPDTRGIPVILLSARAGEEAKVEGLRAGADDYLTKPFSARELVARVDSNLKLANTRREAERLLREEAQILEEINRVGTAVSAELELEKAVQVVTDAATRLAGAAFGAFFYNIVDDKGESYMLYTLSGVPREAFSNFPMPRNTAVFAPTFAGEATVRSADIRKDPRFGKNAPYHGHPEGHLPVVSYLATPVVSRTGEVLGGLFFGHSEDRHVRHACRAARRGDRRAGRHRDRQGAALSRRPAQRAEPRAEGTRAHGRARPVERPADGRDRAARARRGPLPAVRRGCDRLCDLRARARRHRG